MNEPKEVTRSFVLTEELLNFLDELKRIEDRSRSAVVRRILEAEKSRYQETEAGHAYVNQDGER